MKDDESAPQIKGDRNQAIGQNYGTAIANVKGNVTIGGTYV